MASTPQLKVIEDGQTKKQLLDELTNAFFGVTPMLSDERIKEIAISTNPKGKLKAVPTDSSD